MFSSCATNIRNCKCSYGKSCTQPLAAPGRWNNDPVQLCQQLVIPF